MRYTFLSLAVLGLTTVSAQNFSPNISSGKMPTAVKSEKLDKLATSKALYKNGWTDNGWTVSQVGTTGYAFVSPSYSPDKGAQDNRLILNTLTIEKGAVVSWKARSVYADFPDTYKVVAKAEGDNYETVLFEGEGEDIFTPHSISLDKFAGKKTDITFVCNSTDGYMLAVMDIFVGVPSEPKLYIKENTSRFAGDVKDIRLFGMLTNYGASTVIKRISVTVDNKEVATKSTDLDLKNGETTPFSVHLPVELNVKTDYTINFHDQNDKIIEEKSGSAMASWFTRTHFVDEGTGMWCNNCPDGTISIAKFERENPGQHAVVSTHTGDIISNEEYWPGLKFYAVPYFMLNRIESTKNSSRAYFDNGLWLPTEVEITLTFNDYELGVSLRSHNDLDNSTDRYRLGYVISADHYLPDDSSYYQQNSLIYPNREEYYFLPTLIPTYLCKFHGVNIGGEGYFTGLPKSIPARVESMQPTQCMYLTPDFPPEGENGWYNPRANVYVLDTESGVIMNCATILLNGTQNEVISNVRTVENESPVRLAVRDGYIKLSGTRSAKVGIHSLSGSLIWSGICDGEVSVPQNAKGMPVVINAKAEEGTAVIKTIL